ncbi:MAG: HEAT repeat domain-containing protein [Candidatus Poribacteria bacterium]|nr:HEAT repeat domain-containing protein [Candidatus Poribacteria bacterium]
MPSFEQLTQNLTDTSQPIATRRAAVIEIGNLGGAKALPILLKALSDTAPGVRREAASALQKCDFQEATSALVDALKDEESDLTRWTLIEAIGNIGDVSALPALESLLSTDVSPLTRREVQKSIDLITARYPDTDAVETTSENSDPVIASTDSPDFSDLPSLEMEQPELSQETTSENVTVDEYPDDSPPNSDELIIIEDTSESQPIAEQNIPSDDIETPIIDLTIDEEPQTNGTASEEVDSTASSQTSATDIEDDTVPPKDPVPRVEMPKRHGSTIALPVLVPNTSVVIYEQEDEKFKPSVFAIMLRPNAYLSKRWVYRTRLYLTLLFLLVAATIALVYSQVQRHPRPPYLPSTEIAFVENPQHYLDAGSFFIQQSDYRSAIEMYELIRGIDSMDPVLYKNLGFAHFQENQYALSVEAYEFYLQARKTKPYQPFIAEASYSSSIDDSDKGDSSNYRIYNTLGTAHRRLGNLHKARLAYETAIKIAPNEAEAYNNLAQLYSDGYQQKHLLTEALAYAAVRLNPDVASYHDTLGWILGKSEQFNKATNALEQAIRLQNDYVPAFYHLTEIAQKSKHSEKDIQVVQDALIKKMYRTRKSRQSIQKVLSHIYETESQKIPRFSSSFLHLRGIER